MNQWNLKKICNTQKNGKPRKLWKTILRTMKWQKNQTYNLTNQSWTIPKFLYLQCEKLLSHGLWRTQTEDRSNTLYAEIFVIKKWKIPLQRAVWNTKFLKFMNKIEKPPAKVFLKDSCINLTFRNFTVKTKNCQAKITLWKLHSGQRNDKIIKPKILQ